MGIVIKQALRTTIYSYFGAVLGFLTVWFVYRKWLTTEQNGLINLLISISAITGSLSNLGMNGVILRLFPYFRNDENKHHGFFFFPLIITCVGYLVFLLLYFVFKDEFIARNEAKSALLNENIFYLIPLTLFTALFYIFDTYSRSLYLTTPGIVIKEVLLRIGILIAAYTYHIDLINFETFVLIYCGLTSSIALALGIYLMVKRKIGIKTTSGFVSTSLRGEMVKVAIFSIITGLSSLLISTLDKIIVNDKLGLASAGVFAIATYFGSIIQIPGRSIVRISAPVVAESWKTGDIENIKSIYHKTCLNQMILGLFIFLAIAVNQNNIIQLLPQDYAEGRWVIVLMSLAYLIDMATGVNGVIISTSKYFRYDTYFMFLLVIGTWITNVMLIPKWGLTGAAIAAVITFTTYNFLRYLFILRVFKMQPYDTSFLRIIFFALIAFVAAIVIPDTGFPYLNVILRGMICSGIFAVLVFRSSLAPDINATILKYGAFLFRSKS